MHLGNRPREVELNNGVWCWAFGSIQYVSTAVTYVQE